MANPNINEVEEAYLDFWLANVSRDILVKRFKKYYRLAKAFVPIARSHPSLGGEYKLTVDEITELKEAMEAVE